MKSAKPVQFLWSFDMARSPDDFPQNDVEDHLHEGEAALCRAKRASRNCVRIAQPESAVKKRPI
jgi:hypothetical protein